MFINTMKEGNKTKIKKMDKKPPTIPAREGRFQILFRIADYRATIGIYSGNLVDTLDLCALKERVGAFFLYRCLHVFGVD